MKKIAIALIPVFLVACASTPEPITPVEVKQGIPAAIKPAPVISAAPERTILESAAEIEARRLAAQKQALEKQSVYFDYDDYVVKPVYQDIIQQQAAFIKAHRNDIVTLEGNADERGSNEYNLALGDKRANAVRKSLELLGVPAMQIMTVSMGEEKPRLTCHEENCWKENRRNDFFHKLN